MAEITPREFVDQELRLMEGVFNARGVLAPMVVLIKDNRRYATPVKFHNDVHKDIMSQGLKDLVKKSNPDIVIYAAEAWSAHVKEYIDGVTPPASLQPNRIEVVVVRIEFKTGEKYDCQAKIIREQKKVYLDKFKIMPGGRSMGRFVDFYPIGRTN